MVVDDGMAECGCFTEEVWVEIVAAKGGLRPVDRRFEQSLIAQPKRPPALRDDLLIEVRDLLEMQVLHALANRFNSN